MEPDPVQNSHFRQHLPCPTNARTVLNPVKQAAPIGTLPVLKLRLSFAIEETLAAEHDRPSSTADRGSLARPH